MASIKDALEESVQDVNSTLKFFLYTIPLYFTVSIPLNGHYPVYYPFLYVFTGLLLFGFMLKCTYNLRRGEQRILPGFNIFEVLYIGFKGLVALIPLGILGSVISVTLIAALANYLEGALFAVFSIIINAICSSFVATGYLLYAKNFKIVDAYNIRSIFKYCADVMIAVFFMEILIIIADIILIAPITYLIWIFFGLPNPVALFFWCMIFVLNCAMAGHYLAQIDYEIIELNEEEIRDAELRFAKKK